jgi:HAD superfamily hydrolase (TIGR01509 family)
MPSRFQAVVFDLDGLMFDTEALFYRVAAEMLAARGKEFTPRLMGAMIGRRAAEAVHAFKEIAGIDEPPDVLLAETRTRFDAEVDTAVHPTSGLFVLLDRLRHHGLPRGVATSSGRAYAERLLGSHGLREQFAFILAGEDVTRGKPDPEIYRKAAARFAVPAQAMIVLEDSPAGLAAARGAGAFAVGIPHEHSPVAGLHDAHLIVPRLDDPALLALLDGDATHD